MRHLGLITAWHTGTHTMEEVLAPAVDKSLNCWQVWGERRNLEPGKRYLFHTHATPPRFYPENQVGFTWKLAKEYQTIITLRDPLAALISRHARGSNGQDDMIVEQFKMLIELSPHCEVTPIEQYETRLNVSPDSDLKVAYAEGDLGTIQDKLQTYGYLKQHESILRPFLESHGYTDLLWYD